MTIAGPGGTKNFFSDPPSGTVFALGSLVDVGSLQSTMARGALKTGDIVALLHFFTHIGITAKIACRVSYTSLTGLSIPGRGGAPRA